MLSIRKSINKRMAKEMGHTSTKGCTTYEFFNSVKERISKDWLKPDHFTTQFLSGHGSFKSYLFERGLSEDPDCKCGAEQSNKHILFECTEVDEIRRPLKQKVMSAGHAWPCELSVMVLDEGLFRELGAFARKYLEKEQSDPTEQI
ncbi:hypothetical protein TSAR_006293 [Trichomalopsis sarcophagae]|uniref:Reverse transcriptase zinc-binding domain-containing protein n=1 Tax=Trichomalopsis sarcophagae TaxID=543379 RepID=A0A232EFS0_9HYME|nr:hypothetical protein TSAR_006293 [Trichomalopsis sarcophagae]